MIIDLTKAEVAQIRRDLKTTISLSKELMKNKKGKESKMFLQSVVQKNETLLKKLSQ